MTITTNQTAAEHTTEQAVTVPDTAADAARGSLRHVDPNRIVVETNARTLPILSTEWIAELTANGVMTPVSGWLNEAGEVVVRSGQRRVLGAREAGLATIPVYLTIQSQKTADRIVGQVIENEQREAMTSADLATAYQQLAFEGMGVATIAKRLRKKSAEVKTGLAVAKNEQAAAAVAEHDLDLTHAAALIEFEDDPQTVADLIATAKRTPEQFGHAAQRARDARTRAAAVAKLRAEVEASGVTVLSKAPAYDDKTLHPISKWGHLDGSKIDPTEVIGKPGTYAVVVVHWNGEAKAEYYIENPKAYGFKKRREDGTVSTPMTDEQKAERKTLIANNQAWASAETIRRQFVTDLLSKAKLPKDAAAFVAEALTSYRRTVARAMQDGNAQAHAFLGIERTNTAWYSDQISGWLATHPARTGHVSLAVVLGGIEDSLSKQSWRNPDRDAAAYLSKLTEWGYALSEVEQIIPDVIARRDRATRRPARTTETD